MKSPSLDVLQRLFVNVLAWPGLAWHGSYAEAPWPVLGWPGLALACAGPAWRALAWQAWLGAGLAWTGLT